MDEGMSPRQSYLEEQASRSDESGGFHEPDVEIPSDQQAAAGGEGDKPKKPKPILRPCDCIHGNGMTSCPIHPEGIWVHELEDGNVRRHPGPPTSVGNLRRAGVHATLLLRAWRTPPKIESFLLPSSRSVTGGCDGSGMPV
jgi:hypothetical protein